MIEQQTLEANWDQIKGRIKSRWHNIEDNELDAIGKDIHRLVQLIQAKTSLTMVEIEHDLQEMLDSGDSRMDRAKRTAEEYKQETILRAQQMSEQFSAGLQQGYVEASKAVKTRPLESVAVAFGTGLMAGVMLSLFTSRR